MYSLSYVTRTSPYLSKVVEEIIKKEPPMSTDECSPQMVLDLQSEGEGSVYTGEREITAPFLLFCLACSLYMSHLHWRCTRVTFVVHRILNFIDLQQCYRSHELPLEDLDSRSGPVTSAIRHMTRHGQWVNVILVLACVWYVVIVYNLCFCACASNLANYFAYENMSNHVCTVYFSPTGWRAVVSG